MRDKFYLTKSVSLFNNPLRGLIYSKYMIYRTHYLVNFSCKCSICDLDISNSKIVPRFKYLIDYDRGVIVFTGYNFYCNVCSLLVDYDKFHRAEVIESYKALYKLHTLNEGYKKILSPKYINFSTKSYDIKFIKDNVLYDFYGIDIKRLNKYVTTKSKGKITNYKELYKKLEYRKFKLNLELLPFKEFLIQGFIKNNLKNMIDREVYEI